MFYNFKRNSLINVHVQFVNLPCTVMNKTDSIDGRFKFYELNLTMNVSNSCVNKLKTICVSFYFYLLRSSDLSCTNL